MAVAVMPRHSDDSALPTAPTMPDGGVPGGSLARAAAKLALTKAAYALGGAFGGGGPRAARAAALPAAAAASNRARTGAGASFHAAARARDATWKADGAPTPPTPAAAWAVATAAAASGEPMKSENALGGRGGLVGEGLDGAAALRGAAAAAALGAAGVGCPAAAMRAAKTAAVEAEVVGRGGRAVGAKVGA